MKKAIRICLLIVLVLNAFLLSFFIKKEILLSSVLLGFSLGVGMISWVFIILEEQSKK